MMLLSDEDPSGYDPWNGHKLEDHRDVGIVVEHVLSEFVEFDDGLFGSAQFGAFVHDRRRIVIVCSSSFARIWSVGGHALSNQEQQRAQANQRQSNAALSISLSLTLFFQICTRRIFCFFLTFNPSSSQQQQQQQQKAQMSENKTAETLQNDLPPVPRLDPIADLDILCRELNAYVEEPGIYASVNRETILKISGRLSGHIKQASFEAGKHG
ncbi:MAG: hypothetical protein GY714_04140 [Desulfobacterales bacterium]|nr:hypothetical protein [Desulfobacterales bacterium]